MAALGAHPSLKRVVIVDRDVDVHDAEQVEWAIATRVQPERDIVIIPGARGSSLDPSRDAADDTTAKWIVDATIRLGHGRERVEFLRAEDFKPPPLPTPPPAPVAPSRPTSKGPPPLPSKRSTKDGSA
jgi:3-polyprenyl-4-hydroxybenzoate decarboxylase